jgi:endonuclease/exonuclease/phosphatase family metal-dependent hydrolase
VPAEQLVAACASLDADVLGLQEVDRGQARSAGVDQTEVVARGMGAAAWRFEPAILGEPGGVWKPATASPAADGSEPAYGVGLVSRLPVREWHVVHLRPARGRSPVYVPGRRTFILLPDEPRAAVAALVDGPTGPLWVASCHLSFVPGWNAAQLRRLTREMGGLGHPCVLLGDLNLPGTIPGRVSRWRTLARAKTFPADEPKLQIDHALGHGPLPPVTAVDSRRLPLSDHRALVVDLAGGGHPVPAEHARRVPAGSPARRPLRSGHAGRPRDDPGASTRVNRTWLCTLFATGLSAFPPSVSPATRTTPSGSGSRSSTTTRRPR